MHSLYSPKNASTASRYARSPTRELAVSARPSVHMSVLVLHDVLFTNVYGLIVENICR